ncbi:hypothetical protein [Clostridium saccharoperbutylacetonicum]|uniref:hypothetical protein n=1 Tax=Clostridium saccharoperbutylacetonicum TaxID=36745 RepID=UPI00130E63BF|nr:hypothetical protein [Clostridium saccharoperbutylacetonicum]
MEIIVSISEFISSLVISVLIPGIFKVIFLPDDVRKAYYNQNIDNINFFEALEN